MISVLAAALLVGALLFVLVALARRPRVTVSTEEAVTDTTRTVERFAVQSGEIMTTFLTRAGIEADDADRISAALRTGGFNFRRMRPGDSFTAVRREGRLERVFYRRNFERVYRIDLTDRADHISMVLRRMYRVPTTIRGDIKTSLYAALTELGAKPMLIADFADVFGWEVDFFTETQRHDSFAIYVERRLVDSTPIGYGPIIAARYHGAVGDFTAFRFTDPDNHTDYYNRAGQSLRKTFLKTPLHFSRITSFFGNRYHPIRRIRCEHHGVDYAAPTGTPVSCVADGRVTHAGWMGGYGKLVEVSHANGFKTRYGHLSRFARGARVGAAVTQGQTVGYVGSTGMSTGPHLHYEVRKFGTPINSLRMKVPRVSPVRKAYLPAFNALVDSISNLVPGLKAGTTPPR